MTIALILIFKLPVEGFATSPDLEAKKAEIDKLKSELLAVESQIKDIEEEMISLRGRLQGVHEEIEKAELKKELLSKEIKNREKILAEHVKRIYVENNSYGLELILDSGSFGELLSRIKFLVYLVKNDSENLKELLAAKEELKQYTLLLESDRKKYQLYLQEYQKRIEHLKNLKVQKSRLLAHASEELKLIISRAQRTAFLSSRGTERSGSAYSLNGVVPKKFVEVIPYDGVWITSERMPSKFVATGKKWTCRASWYGNEFHGRRTSSGEIFNQWDYTVAHRSLPFGTYVAIERNGRRIVAKVTDRGPFISGREFDLSRGCAEALGITGVGTINVEIVKPVD